VRIRRFFDATPTPANRLITALRGRSLDTIYATPVPPRVDPADVAFIRRHSEPTEPVAVLSFYDDWIYLADAHRPPLSPWLPVYITYTYRHLDQVEAAYRKADRIFITREGLGFMREYNPPLYQRLAPLLAEYTRIDSGKNLDLYERRSIAHQSAECVVTGRPDFSH
jgi:hypothetical protein